MKILNIKSENNPITKKILRVNVKVIYRNYFLEYILFIYENRGWKYQYTFHLLIMVYKMHTSQNVFP